MDILFDGEHNYVDGEIYISADGHVCLKINNQQWIRMTPLEAKKTAYSLLCATENHLKQLIEAGGVKYVEPKSYLNKDGEDPIEDFFEKKVLMILQNIGAKYIQDLQYLTSTNLFRLANFGRKSLKQTQHILEENGLDFATKIDDDQHENFGYGSDIYERITQYLKQKRGE